MIALTPATKTASTQRKIFTVARLNQEVQTLLESGFGTIWLQAELSNFSRPGSGHWYFSLKDSRAQIRCAMFRGRNQYIKFEPAAGDEVLVRGKLGLYAARGDFQLIVEHMEPAGAGRLQAEYERLLKELRTDGWFAPEQKQALPDAPARIGVVTSPTGAAIQDVLTVLKRRYPVAEVIVYPTIVQGAEAAKSIASAIKTANERSETDVLLLVRGGGSLEDLWAFNEMPVATAIRCSTLPVVSGVGHEVDVTIADWVADHRAATPSAAAEMVTPDREHITARLNDLQASLRRAWQQQQLHISTRLQQWQARLDNCHPHRRIEQQQQRVDELERRVGQWGQHRLRQQQSMLSALQGRLNTQSPSRQLLASQLHLSQQRQRLNQAWQHREQDARNQLKMAMRALHAVSPLATLERGYAIVQKAETVITDADHLTPGDEISARLAHGSVKATVSTISPKK